MSSEAARRDAEIVAQGRGLEDDLRFLMMLTRELRERHYALEPAGLRVLEDHLFAVRCQADALVLVVEGRLAEYRRTLEAAATAIQATEADDAVMVDMLSLVRRSAEHMAERIAARAGLPVEPPVQPTGVLVYTGSYRPMAANDASVSGGAA